MSILPTQSRSHHHKQFVVFTSSPKSIQILSTDPAQTCGAPDKGTHAQHSQRSHLRLWERDRTCRKSSPGRGLSNGYGSARGTAQRRRNRKAPKSRGPREGTEAHGSHDTTSLPTRLTRLSGLSTTRTQIANSPSASVTVAAGPTRHFA